MRLCVIVLLFSTLHFLPMRAGAVGLEADVNAPGGSSMLMQLLARVGVTAPSASSSAFTESSGKSFFSQSTLPSSFIYGGESSNVLLRAWPKEVKLPVDQGDRTVYETTWREPNGGGLFATWRVEVFHHWPAIEFRWIFVNEGKAKCKPLSDVQALDLDATIDARKVLLVHSTGGLYAPPSASSSEAFTLAETKLDQKTASFSLSSAGGRSSARDLPFFVVHADQPEESIFVGVGWSGEWKATVQRDDAKLRITVGMPNMNVALPPGERIISPSILLGASAGPWTASTNVLRRLLYAKYVPLLNGVKPLPPVSWNHWFVLDNRISESILKAQADGAAVAGVEYFCIDSGWFDGGFDHGEGNWTIDKKKFPQGLGPIGDYVAQKGMKLGLWFEPERAIPGSRLAIAHPEWVRGDLVDLGNKDARDWLFEMMKSFIDEGRLQWIRWDFNHPPLSKWNNADAPGQQGLTQIRHIMGLYDLLDRLMLAYPNLFIESCAQGGQRIDLETIRRSHSFWKSDNTQVLRQLRFHETGGNVFLPAQLLNTNLPHGDVAAGTKSLFGGPLGLSCNWALLKPETLQELRKQIALYKELRPLLNEEYYPLFAQLIDEPGWVGWQFHSPSRGEGFVVVVRPETAPYPTAEISLHSLEADATYQWIPLDGAPGESHTLTGAEMSRKMYMELKPNASALYRYKKKPTP